MKMNQSKAGNLLYTNGRIVQKGDFALISYRGLDAYSPLHFKYGFIPIQIADLEYDKTGKKIKRIPFISEQGEEMSYGYAIDAFKAKGTKTLHYIDHSTNNMQDYVVYYLAELEKWLENEGDMDAALALAMYYSNHEPKGRDEQYVLQIRKKARQYFELASQNGHAIASEYLAREHGYYILFQPRDRIENKVYLESEKNLFFDYLIKSGEQGFAQAQFQLGINYEYGREGFPQDYKKAVYWYHEAARQGYPRATNNLADKYEHGLGVAQDYKKAIELYSYAAQYRIPEAMFSLGNLYLQGKGVLCDVIQAQLYFEQSARLGYAPAKRSLKALDIER